MENLEIKIQAYALKNALAHNGKANFGAVLSGLFTEGLKKEEIKDTTQTINQIIEEINNLSLEEQQSKFEKLETEISKREIREGLPELPNSEKGVVMRIAPSASGALHIIHGINASLSFSYVKKYGGTFYVRIEDTNPENIFPQAYELIEQDANWLTKNQAKIIIQSDRMILYYSYAASLIEKDKAYVCTCDAESFRELAKNKQDCPCRKKTIKENIKDWEKMLDKKGFAEGEAVLRFKSDMKHKNPAMRDFPLARINLTEHSRQKNKYRVWPLMNLSVATDDIELNMTHVIRGKDHRDNAERQKLIFEAFDKKYPWSAFLGRYHFKDLELSTTQFRKGIEAGKYSGWDDPKLPTVASLKKQGYKPEAFWKMAEHIGLSEVDKTLDKKEFFKLFDSFNREQQGLNNGKT